MTAAGAARVPAWPLVAWALLVVASVLAAGASWWWLDLELRPAASPRGVAAAAAAGILLTAAAAATGIVLLRRAGRRWIVRRRREWLTALVSGLVSLALGDAILNLSGAVPTVEERRARSLLSSIDRRPTYRLIPQLMQVEGGTLEVNDRGFRGPPLSADKPEGRVRMVFLGGSQMFAFRSNWPALVERELRDRGYDVEIINAGAPGLTTVDSAYQVLTDLWTLDPDLLFLCQAWNDTKYFRRLGRDEPYRGKPPAEPMIWSRDVRLFPAGIDAVLVRSAVYRIMRWRLLDRIVSEEGIDVRRSYGMPRGAPAGSFGPWGPRQYAMNLAVIAAAAKQAGAELVLCRQAWLRRGAGASGMDAEFYARRNVGMTGAAVERAIEACNERAAGLAAERGLRIIDMDGPLGGRPANFWDAIHFSEVGGRAAGLLVADHLERWLRERAQHPTASRIEADGAGHGTPLPPRIAR